MKSIERFVNFSDAVIAIAVTLLVLPLTEHAAGKSFDSYAVFMDEFGQLLFVFLLSFVVICRYWEVHHDLLSSLKTFNTTLFWLNATLLLSIVLMPFTSEIIGNADGRNTFATAVYIANLMIASYVGLVLAWYVRRTPELLKVDALKNDKGIGGIATAIGMTLAMVLNLVIPDLGPLALLVLIPAGYFDKFLLLKSVPSRRQK